MRVIDNLITKLANSSEFVTLSSKLEASSADFSELVELTEQLAQEEERYKETLLQIEKERQQLIAIFEGIDQPIFVCHAETLELLYYNDALEKTVNEPAVGRKCYEILYGIDHPCPDCPLLGNCSEGDAHSFDRYSEKTQRWHHIIHKCISWPNNPYHSAIFGMLIDITERKEAVLAYETLVENSLQGLAIVTSERVIFCNTVFERMVDMPREEIYERSLEEWLACMPADESKIVKDHMAKGLAGGEDVLQRSIIHLDLGRGEMTLEILASAIIFKGEHCVQVAVYDITE